MTGCFSKTVARNGNELFSKKITAQALKISQDFEWFKREMVE